MLFMIECFSGSVFSSIMVGVLWFQLVSLLLVERTDDVNERFSRLRVFQRIRSRPKLLFWNLLAVARLELSHERRPTARQRCHWLDVCSGRCVHLEFGFSQVSGLFPDSQQA